MVFTSVTVLGSAASAEAAVTIGSDLSSSGVPDNCNPAGCQFTNMQTVLPGRQVSSPISGVVVRWRVRSAGGSVRLRIVRPVEGGLFSGLARSEIVNVTSGEVQEFPTRLPIEAGNLIGIDGFDTTAFRGFRDAPGAFVQSWYPLQIPEDGTPSNDGGLADFELLLNADIEPDADADGFGDESQNITFSKTPKKKTKSRNATFQFTGPPNAECRIDKKAFKPCTSPRKYRKLKPRKHTFRVHGLLEGGALAPDEIFRWRVLGD
jgi:hypothetical protein